MTRKTERWFAIGLILVYIIALTTPFVYAFGMENQEVVFGGFLINPIDNNSYLTKMRQGYNGNWLFTLPYTADSGEGTAINLYYIFLGHVARAAQFSLIFTFHLARVVGALLLAIALYGLVSSMVEQSSTRMFALGLVLFGSGLGWLAILIGLLTSDFWVTEAYPFLAGLANPHFTIGLALQVWLLTPVARATPSAFMKVSTFLAVFLLSVIYLFGWLVTASVLGAWTLWKLYLKSAQREDWQRLLLVGVAGAPYAFYAWWTVNHHAALAQWNAQNVTPAPSPLDLLISLSPALILALLAIPGIFKSKETRFQFLLIWLFVDLLLVYSPLNLQRRLISGIFVPVALLAVHWIHGSSARSRISFLVLFILSIPTNILILTGALQAVAANAPQLTIYQPELAAFSWLEESAPPGSLVLAGPETGLLIPAYTDARVVYGHPFETVNAESKKSDVTEFFSGQLTSVETISYLQSEGIDYLFYGPREREIGLLPEIPGWAEIVSFKDVVIWGAVQ
ncbi:MAG: hypothetical protein ACRDFQ_04125 [Anaerolineales bacterium]